MDCIFNSTTGTITYYMQFVENPTAYRVQLISYALPTSLPAGSTNGGGITFPTVSRQPQLVVNQTGFGSIKVLVMEHTRLLKRLLPTRKTVIWSRKCRQFNLC